MNKEKQIDEMAKVTGVELYGIREVQAYPKCSVCGYMGDVSGWHFKYCPNC